MRIDPSFYLLAPAWMPKIALGLYVRLAATLLSFGIVFRRPFLQAPVYMDWAYGANAGHKSTAQVCDDKYQIVEAHACWTTAGTDGGNVTLTIEKLTGTQAPGGGANMFKTSTINLKGAINTVDTLKVSTLSGLTAAQLAAQQVNRGDRISATLTGTLTTLDGLAVLVILKRLPSSNNAR